MTIDPTLPDRGEKVLWWGKPDPQKYAFRKAWYSFLLGIPFFSFAVFWTYMTSRGGVFAAFGIPFLLIGLGMLLSPTWHCPRHARDLCADGPPRRDRHCGLHATTHQRAVEPDPLHRPAPRG